MKDFKTLQLLDKIQFIFVKMGIDYEIMRKILHIKLTMDERKVPTIFNQSSKKNKEEQKYGYIKSLWIYALMGLMLIPFMGFGQNYLFQMSIAYAMIIFIIMTTLISDFSSVLLDVRDRSILSTKPISAKTINAAKFMHIFIYLTYLTIAFTAIPLIVSLYKQGIVFFILTVLLLVLINIFIVVLTAILYIAILRFFDGEKLKDIINYVQIGLSLMLMIGYQLLIRSFELVNFDMVVTFHWWSIFLIPMWFAAPYELLLNGDSSLFTVVCSIFAVVIPIISIWLYLKLIPTFERNLQKLLSTSKSKKEKSNKLKAFLLKIICRTNEERAFYRFASLMMKQEREFKLKVYPSLGYSFVIPFIFMYSFSRSDDVDYSVSMSYLNIYFSMLIIPSAVLLLGYSGKYKAAWIYKVFPLKDYTDLKKGSLKAFLIKLYSPLYIVLSIIFCFIFGTRIIPDLMSVLVASCMYTVICYIAIGSKIPFTKPYNEVGDAQSWKTLILLIPLGALVGLHYYLTTHISYGAIIYLLVLVITNFALWKLAFKRTKTA
jgi:ABC-2 type transport system permease protein